MIVLALDSSRKTQSAAIYDYGAAKVLAADSLSANQRRQQSSAYFMPMIIELFEKAQLTAKDIDLVAVCTGPGSFTGIRTALTIAKTIAIENKKDIFAVNNFELLRYEQSIDSALAIEAGKNDYFISKNTNYQDSENNYFSLENDDIPVYEFKSENISTLITSFIAEKLKDNLEKYISKPENIFPYYMREPSIGQAKPKNNSSEIIKNEDYDKGFKAFTEGDFELALKLLKQARDQMNKSKKKAHSSEDAKYRTKLNEIYKLIAEANLELKDLEQAKKNFLNANLFAQAAFCAVLARDLILAKELYEKSSDSLAKHWGLFLCQILDLSNDKFDLPGFLSIRLFLESTVTYFMIFNLDDYLETFIKNSPQIENYFPEFRKYIGSAYLSLGQYQKSIEILGAALKSYPEDSEIYFKLAQNYMLLEQKEEAIKNFNKTLNLLPEHIASLKYLEKLKV